jgi:hypothetical protein
LPFAADLKPKMPTFEAPAVETPTESGDNDSNGGFSDPESGQLLYTAVIWSKSHDL